MPPLEGRNPIKRQVLYQPDHTPSLVQELTIFAAPVFDLAEPLFSDLSDHDYTQPTMSAVSLRAPSEVSMTMLPRWRVAMISG